MLRFIFCTW